MEKQRYVESGENSFYGKYLYDQIVPADHFLRMLNEIIDWKRYTRKLIRFYTRGKGWLVVHRLTRHWCLRQT